MPTDFLPLPEPAGIGMAAKADNQTVAPAPARARRLEIPGEEGGGESLGNGTALESSEDLGGDLLGLVGELHDLSFVRGRRRDLAFSFPSPRPLSSSALLVANVTGANAESHRRRSTRREIPGGLDRPAPGRRPELRRRRSP
jgi:hypothetical protein